VAEVGELLAVAGLVAACALWVVVQRWAQRVDPQSPGLDRCCRGCAGACRLEGEGASAAASASERRRSASAKKTSAETSAEASR
jgi:hypothetical protein